MTAIVDFLIVDDEEEWQIKLKELVGEKYTTRISHSLEDALTLIERQYFYCALVDKNLIPIDTGDKSGGMVLERLASQAEGTKGLMITNYPDDWQVEKAALRDWNADYLAKGEISSVEGFKKVREALDKMHEAAMAEYNRRYGSGIAQLTADFQSRDKAGWESSLITMLSSPGKRVDYKMLAQFLDNLMKELSPLIPYKYGDSIQIDKEKQIIDCKYWSKGLGEPIVVRLGKKNDIESEKSLLPSEKIIRYVDKFSLGGMILKAEFDFAELPSSDKKG